MFLLKNAILDRRANFRLYPIRKEAIAALISSKIFS